MLETNKYEIYKKIDKNYKSPLLFSIPLDIYSDEIGKDRDKKSYLKIQKLAEKCDQLRQRFTLYAEMHSIRLETTKYLLWRTKEVRNNTRRKKNDSDENKYLMY